MTRRAVLISISLAMLGSWRCGKKGPILPPLARVPQSVQEISLSRVGNRVVLDWANPAAYIDGNPLKAQPEIEVWVIEEAESGGTAAAKPAKGDFEKKGRLVTKIPGRPALPGGKETAEARGSAILEPDPAALAQKSLFFSLRARDEKRRPSEFSEPVGLAPAPCLPPPRGLTASLLEKSIDLTWISPVDPTDPLSSKVAGYNVYRAEGEGVPLRLTAAPVAALEFHDQDAALGKVYTYFVRSAAAAAAGGYESENSEPVKVEPVDKFPPDAPQGLTVISGEGFIALSWEPSKEPDLAGYRVWRRGPGQTPAALLRELSPAENSFYDTEVENGRQYVYSITAFDRAGNESPQSAEAAGLARRPRD